MTMSSQVKSCAVIKSAERETLRDRVRDSPPGFCPAGTSGLCLPGTPLLLPPRSYRSGAM